MPALGTVIVSGSLSTLTSASRPQASQVAVTMRTPFWRMFISVIGGPKLFRIGDRLFRSALDALQVVEDLPPSSRLS